MKQSINNVVFSQSRDAACSEIRRGTVSPRRWRRSSKVPPNARMKTEPVRWGVRRPSGRQIVRVRRSSLRSANRRHRREKGRWRWVVHPASALEIGRPVPDQPHRLARPAQRIRRRRRVTLRLWWTGVLSARAAMRTTPNRSLPAGSRRWTRPEPADRLEPARDLLIWGPATPAWNGPPLPSHH